MNDQTKSELEVLKDRARQLGIKFSNNISVETLRKKVQDVMGEGSEGDEDSEDAEQAETVEDASEDDSDADGEDTAEAVDDAGDVAEDPEVVEEVEETPAPAPTPTPTPTPEPAKEEPKAEVQKELTPAQKKQAARRKMQKEAMALVRLRITNLDPKKSSIPGEIITVANRYIGTVRKFVPFGEQTEQGYHVPHVIYEELKARKFLSIKVLKNKATGREYTKTEYVREFALEVLDPLTAEELQELKDRQLSEGGRKDDD